MSPLLPYLLFVALGLALGLLHFGTLRLTTRAFLAGRMGSALAHQLLRMAALAGALVLLARQGAAPLLAGLVGLLVGRQLVLARERA